MARPRIFLSSTCYDLSMVRNELTEFLETRGFEVINSEKHSFGVTPGRHSHTACLDEVDIADYLLLLIGKHRGGTYIGSESSITNEEYNRAVSRSIPTIICVLREVEEYRRSYKRNPSGDHSHIVDDIRIFHFIDYISSGHTDNWIHKFESIDDLRQIITTQTAHYLYLFSQSLRPKARSTEKDVSIAAFPSNLDALRERGMDQDDETAMRNGLNALHKILADILNANIKQDAKLEKLKCIWVFGRYGELSWTSDALNMKMDLFKQYAWSYHKGERVFNQFVTFRANGGFDEEGGTYFSFKEEDEDTAIALALKDYISMLLETNTDKDAYELFCRADMRGYMKT